MKRAAFLCGTFTVLLMMPGCATWQDEAHADALARCDGQSEPEQRRICRETIIAAAEAEHRTEMDKLGQRILEAEERERQRQVYGGPGQVDR